MRPGDHVGGLPTRKSCILNPISARPINPSAKRILPMEENRPGCMRNVSFKLFNYYSSKAIINIENASMAHDICQLQVCSYR
jgi:hypothetical protein